MNEDKIHKKYIEILRNMTSQQKIDKVFELNLMADELFKYGLRKRFPSLSKEEFDKLYKSRIEKCYNRNW
jgi:Trp operon repressor